MALAGTNKFRVNLGNKMMDVADMFAESGEQPSDPRAWRHLLIYCPRELLEARIAELDRKPLKRIEIEISNLVTATSAAGIYDCNRYMHGVANGVRLAQALINQTEVEYLRAPEIWLDDMEGEHHDAEALGDVGTIPQAQAGAGGSAGAHEPDRGAGAGAGGDDPEGNQSRGRTPPDGALC